jgi:hypothetical protein
VERIGDVALHLLDTDLDDRNQIGLLLDASAGHRRASGCCSPLTRPGSTWR